MSWVQEEHLRKFYITYLNPNRAVPDGVPTEGAVKAVDLSITPDQMTVLDGLEPIVFLGEQPTQRDHVYFTNDTGHMEVGLFDSTPFETQMAPYPLHEFKRMLDGEIVITEENGTAHHFKQNDAFFIPMGTVCSWTTTGYVKELYATVA